MNGSNLEALAPVLQPVRSFLASVTGADVRSSRAMSTALNRLQDAVLETRQRIAEFRRAGGEHSGLPELVHLWKEASKALRPVDANLAALCFVKADYWADPTRWSDGDVADAHITLDEMRDVLTALLIAGAPASSKSTQSRRVGGYHFNSIAGNVNIQAGGDVVAGDKVTSTAAAPTQSPKSGSSEGVDHSVAVPQSDHLPIESAVATHTQSTNTQVARDRGGGTRRRRTILVVASSWGPQFGGINAFNEDLCRALGRSIGGSARVICLTAPCGDDVRADAMRDHVELITLRHIDAAPPAEVAVAARRVLLQAGIHSTDLVIGHDVVTGPAAAALVEQVGSRLAVIHHMSYGSYQAVKKQDGREASRKEEEQTVMLRRANVVLAVGPALRRSAEAICQHKPPATVIVPGLPAIEPIVAREGQFRAITFGRLGAEDDRIKQGSLAAYSFGQFIRKANEIDLRRDFRLNVVGLSADDYDEENRRIQGLVEGQSGRNVNVVAVPYMEDRSSLFEKLRNNEVALMLSWHEGFGLAGWEAIAAQVPLIVSLNSGLYELLRDKRLENLVYPIDVRGSINGTVHPQDVEVVSATLLRIATNYGRALENAKQLRAALAGFYTWERCAETILHASES